MFEHLSLCSWEEIGRAKTMWVLGGFALGLLIGYALSDTGDPPGEMAVEERIRQIEKKLDDVSLFAEVYRWEV